MDEWIFGFMKRQSPLLSATHLSTNPTIH